MGQQRILVMALLLALPAFSLGAGSAEDKVVAAIEKWGGKVTRDAKTKGNPVIRVNLVFSKITDEQLAELGGLKSLQELDLYGTKISNDGLKHLGSLQHLHTLDLAVTKVTDEGMKEIRLLKKLHKLGLGETKVTGAGSSPTKKATRSAPRTMRKR